MSWSRFLTLLVTAFVLSACGASASVSPGQTHAGSPLSKAGASPSTVASSLAPTTAPAADAPSAAPTSSATEQSAAWPTGSAWLRVPFAGEAGTVSVSDVVTDGRVALAFGTGGIWESTDGVHWSAAATGVAGEQPLQILAGPLGGFIAIAGSGDGPTVWTSPDGRTWQGHDGLAGRPDALLPKVRLVVGHGLVVMTTDWATEKREISWSRDGSDWHLATSAGTGGLPRGPIVVTDAGFVAFDVGSSAGVWGSPDGRTWSRVARARAPTYVDPDGVTRADGLGAIVYFKHRYIGTNLGGVVVSTDLVTWRKLDRRAFDGWGPEEFVAFGGKLYAVVQGDAHAPAGIWRSNDGVTWSKLVLDPGLPKIELGGLAVFQGHVIVAASDEPTRGPMAGPSNESVLVSRDLQLDSSGG